MDVPLAFLALLAAPWLFIAGVIGLSIALAPKPPPDEAKVLAGKYAVKVEGPFVFFVIGLYVHPRKWWRHWFLAARVALAMERMKRELAAHPEYGCTLVRHTDVVLSNPTLLVQVWRSYDDLAAYARNNMAKHLGTWLMYKQESNKFEGREVPGLGIFHEAYLVQADQYEAIYGNCPRIGLGKVGQLVPANHGRMRSGKGRLGMTDGSDYEEVHRGAKAE